MGLFDRFFRKAKASDQGTIPMVSTVDNFGAFGKASSGEGLAEYRGWAYACIRAISEKVSTLDFKLNRRRPDGSPEPVESHPVLDLVRDVNPYMLWRDVLVATQSFLELDGNAFWWVYRGPTGKGAPQAIWPLRPDQVAVIPDKELFIKGYVYRIGNTKIELKPENVIHFKEFNPKDYFRGLGTVQAAASAINSDNYAREWNKDFFKNGAQVSGVIYKDGNMTPVEYKELRDKWRDQYQGAGKSHRTAILGGGLKYEPLGLGHADMDFVNLRTFSRDEILALFRVPKTVLGVTDGTATRATAETTEYVFMKETIKPKMEKIADTINEYLLPMYGDDPLYFTFADPVPQNRELDLLTYQNGLANGWLSINDVRRRENLPEIEGGDAVMLPFTATPFGEPVKSVKPAQVAGKTAKKNAGQLLAEAIAPVVKLAIDMDDFEKRGGVWQKGQVNRARAYEKKLAKIMAEYFGEQKDRVLKKLEQQVKSKAIKAKIDLFDEEFEEEELVKKVKTFFETLVAEEGNQALDLAGINMAFDVRNDRIQHALQRKLETLAGDVNGTTSEKVRDAIGEGLQAGEALPDLQKRVENLTAFDKARTEVIARTEVVRAQNFASVEAWRESDLVEGKIWYTAEDERVDDSCADLHANQFNNFEPLPLDDEFPGGEFDPTEEPPLHPNCRCTVLPVVKERKDLRVHEAKETPAPDSALLTKLAKLDTLIETYE